MELLWSQEAKGNTALFPAQTVTLNKLKNYDGAMVQCVLQNVTGWMSIYYYSNLKGGKVQALYCNDRGAFFRRDITINDTSVTFSDGSSWNINYTSGFVAGNQVMYPIAIYGYNT